LKQTADTFSSAKAFFVLLRTKTYWRYRRPQQSGFSLDGLYTIDAILVLRLLTELHRAYNRPLHVAYIDIESAFDSVDRKAQWKALRGSSIPPSLLHLIQDTFTTSILAPRSGFAANCLRKYQEIGSCVAARTQKGVGKSGRG